MIDIPKDVLDWLTGVFRNCNRAATSKMTTVPHAHEPWIDFAIIENLQQVSSMFSFDSGWLVNIDTHWLGSAPLWPEMMPRWEIAGHETGVIGNCGKVGQFLSCISLIVAIRFLGVRIL
jgi:hypothetical protein